MWAAAIGLFVVAARYAWMSDDSFVTLRTIDNVWRGYGLRWNVMERVQAYTHPLWMLLVGACYGVTREPYFTTLAVSGMCLLGQIAILIRRLAPPQALLALTMLMASRAFVDYSTSGLENPLTHLLLTGFCLAFLRRDGHHTAAAVAVVARYRTLVWLAAACVLTRMDLALLVAPVLIVETWRLGLRPALPQALLAALPVVAWHAFTLIYYGALVPNTALAKLGTGIPWWQQVEQGLWYLRDSLRTDYVTLPIVAIALALAIAGRRAWPLAAGMLASLAYVVWVGGDFMSGRFLTAIGVCAVLIVAQHVNVNASADANANVNVNANGNANASANVNANANTKRNANVVNGSRVVAIAVSVVLLAGILSPRSTLRIWPVLEPEYPWVNLLHIEDLHGIVDERRVYDPDTGLMRVSFGKANVRNAPMSMWGRSLGTFPKTSIQLSIGFFGYYGGPALHTIDIGALSEPFLARLPANLTFGGPRFRPGHYGRSLPEGYLESVEACLRYVMPHGAYAPTDRTCVEAGDAVNQLKDPKLRALFDDVTLVTQGRLFTVARWQAIWRLLRHRPTAAESETGE